MLTEAMFVDGLQWVVRVALGLMFLVSGVAKLGDVRGFAAGVLEYRVLPASIAAPLARLLPLTEIVVGIVLLSGMAARAAATAALLLVATFALAVLVNLMRGRSIRCLCLGASSQELIGGATLLRLATLGLMAGWLLWRPSDSGLVPTTNLGLLTAMGSMVLSVSSVLWLLSPAEAILREVSAVRRHNAAGRSGAG